METTRDRPNDKLYLSQKIFVEKVLNRFTMNNVKPASTPLAAKFKFSKHLSLKTENEKSCMSQVPYSSAVGNIMYLMVCTRPDIAYVVST